MTRISSSSLINFSQDGLGSSSTADWKVDGAHTAERCALFIPGIASMILDDRVDRGYGCTVQTQYSGGGLRFRVTYTLSSPLHIMKKQAQLRIVIIISNMDSSCSPTLLAEDWQLRPSLLQTGNLVTCSMPTANLRCG